jgi:hypothetical protein
LASRIPETGVGVEVEVEVEVETVVVPGEIAAVVAFHSVEERRAHN